MALKDVIATGISSLLIGRKLAMPEAGRVDPIVLIA
jgi:hypothetical protein